MILGENRIGRGQLFTSFLNIIDSSGGFLPTALMNAEKNEPVPLKYTYIVFFYISGVGSLTHKLEECREKGTGSSNIHSLRYFLWG